MTSLDSYVKCYTTTVHFEKWKKTNKAHLRCFTRDGHPHVRFTLCGVDAPFGAGNSDEYRYAASLEVCKSCERIRVSLDQAQSRHNIDGDSPALGQAIDMQSSPSGNCSIS